MSLLAQLTARLLLLALLSFGFALAFVAVDTQRTVEAETQSSANRVAREIAKFDMLGSWGATLLQRRDLASVATVMAPGVCANIDHVEGGSRRLCSGWNALGSVAPDWFRRLFLRVVDAGAAKTATVSTHGGPQRIVRASYDPVAAATRAWHQLRVTVGLAAAVALGMSVLGAIAVVHALKPVGAIVDGLKRLQAGDYSARLPAFRTAEFARIAGAVDHLAAALDRSTAERSALMRRLFLVQEEERRGLARELHDEFGQCLTAAGALAASLEAGVPERRRDLKEEARAISRIVKDMMGTLRGAFARLRPPDLDEVGLEASLKTMLRGWNATSGARTRFSLHVDGDLSTLSPEASLDAYRIVQEGVTNAARHGSPSRVHVTVRREGAGAGAVVLTVDDDGGGRLVDVANTTGFGLMGIRERVGALGGSLTIASLADGIRMAARLPARGGVSSEPRLAEAVP